MTDELRVLTGRLLVLAGLWVIAKGVVGFVAEARGRGRR